MIVAILQARTSSSRLPNKVLRPLLGVPMMQRQIERILRSQSLDKLIVATSTDQTDDAIASLCKSLSVECYRGSLTDVLDRLYNASVAAGAVSPTDHIVRLTADCPLFDASVLDRLVQLHAKGDFDYSSNAHVPSFPDGLDCEIMKFETLKAAWTDARAATDREHATHFIYTHPDRFRLGLLKSTDDLSNLRWTVDEKDDFAFVEAVYEELFDSKNDFGMNDVLDLLRRRPELEELGSTARRNEGLEKSLKSDQTIKISRND